MTIVLNFEAGADGVIQILRAIRIPAAQPPYENKSSTASAKCRSCLTVLTIWSVPGECCLPSGDFPRPRGAILTLFALGRSSCPRNAVEVNGVQTASEHYATAQHRMQKVSNARISTPLHCPGPAFVPKDIAWVVKMQCRAITRRWSRHIAWRGCKL